MNIKPKMCARNCVGDVCEGCRKFKPKKHIKILVEINRMKKANARYCDLNDCEPSDYMLGNEQALDELTEFIKKL